MQVYQRDGTSVIKGVRRKMKEHSLHVFDGAAESVGDCAVVNRLFTQPEVCQLYMAW